jgi:hypothetical protein
MFADRRSKWYCEACQHSAPGDMQEDEMSPVAKLLPQKDLDEVFPRPPLREVAFEVRFATRLRVNAELWTIQDEIVDEYPALSLEQLIQPTAHCP